MLLRMIGWLDVAGWRLVRPMRSVHDVGSLLGRRDVRWELDGLLRPFRRPPIRRLVDSWRRMRRGLLLVREIVWDLVVVMVVDVIGGIRAEERVGPPVTTFQVVERIQGGLQEWIHVGIATVPGPIGSRRDPSPSPIVWGPCSDDAGRRMCSAEGFQRIILFIFIGEQDGSAPARHIPSLSLQDGGDEDEE